MFSRSATPSDPVYGSGAVGHHNRALLAASAVLLVAYSNISFTGLLFLCCFLYWGASCIATPYAATSYKHHKKLWTATTAAALLLIVLQLLVQLLVSLHLLPSSSSSEGQQQQQDLVVVVVLDALGLGSMAGLRVEKILLLLVAPVLCVLAAAAEASEASQILAVLETVPPQLCVTPQQQQQRQRTADQQPPPSAAAAETLAAAADRGSNDAAVAAFCPAASIPLSLGLHHTNSGVITAVTLLLSAVLWPSCLNLVYMLIISWGVVCWGWGSPKTWISTGWAVSLQAYTGVHLLLLYVAQLSLLQITNLDLLYDLLGLYNIGDTAHIADSGVHGGSGVLATQIVHMICLHLLYVSIGCYVGLLRQPLYKRVAAAVRQHCKQQQQQQQRKKQGPRRQNSKLTEDLLKPLLMDDDSADNRLEATQDPEASSPQQQQQQQQQAWQQSTTNRPDSLLQPAAPDSSNTATTLLPAATTAGQSSTVAVSPSPAAAAAAAAGPTRTAAGRWDQTVLLLQVLLPFLIGCGDFLLLQLLAAPAVAGITIAGFSLVQVSVVGCATLLLALWSLLAPSRLSKHLLPVASPYLLLFYLTWLVNAYIATALDGIVTPPTPLTSIGVWGYSQQYPALLPLLLHLLTAVAVAGLSRNNTAAAGGMGGIFLPAAVAAAAGLTDWGLLKGTAAAAVDPTAAVATTAAAADGAQQAAAGVDGVDNSRSLSQSSDTAAAAANNTVTAAGRELRQLLSLGSRISSAAAAAAAGGGGSNISIPPSPTSPQNLGGSAPTTPLNRVPVSQQCSITKPQRAASLNISGSSPSSWTGFSTMPGLQEGPLNPGAQQVQNPSFPQQSNPSTQQQTNLSPATAGSFNPGSDPLTSSWSELLSMLWAGFGTGLIQVAWHLGRGIVPLSCVILAASQPDVLHGVYLLALLLELTGSSSSSTWGLTPAAPALPAWFQHTLGVTVISPNGSGSSSSSSSSQPAHALPAAHLPHHRLLRFYGSCHLLVVYLAVVMQLPGLQSDWNEYILKLVGLWDPKILSDLIPVMLLLVTATVHVTLGKWLMTRPPAGAWGFPLHGRNNPAAAAAAQGLSGPDQSSSAAAAAALGPLREDSEHGQSAGNGSSAATRSSSMLLWFASIHPRLLYQSMTWCCRLAASAGAAVAVLMGYLLLLWDIPVGLLGCAYLLLLVLLLLLPPKVLTAAATKRTTRRQQQQQQRRRYWRRADLPLTEDIRPLLDEETGSQPGTTSISNDGSSSSSSSNSSSSSKGSWRWLLQLLLSVLCVTDLAAQYVLVVGALVQDRQLLPPDLSLWIKDVVGIDDAAAGGQLLAALLRPSVLLLVLALYRYCFSIGALLIQQDTAAAANPSASESSSAAAAASPAGHALAAQSSWLWLIKRWLILHSDLILGATCFAAAMQAPSALGLLLLCSILILALQQNMLAAALRGRSASRLRQQQGSSTSSSRGGLTSRGSTDLFVDGCVIALQVFSAAWLLMVYVSQVKWVRSLLLDHAPPLLPWLLLWLGLPVSGDDLDQAQVQGLGLEQIMRYKVIMLAAAAVRSKAQQWQQQLPEAVVAAESAHGNPCPLFWPPRSAAAAAAGGFGSKPSDHHQHHESGVQGDTVSRTSGSRSAAAAAARPDSQAVGWDELEPVWRTAEQIVSPLYALGLWALHQLGLQTSKVLAAMDIPERAAQVAIYTAATAQQQQPSSSRRQQQQQAPPQQPHSTVRVLASKLLKLFTVLSASARDFCEGFWPMWGAECVMLLLLAAAMLSSNAWSLVYMLLVGLGMAAFGSSGVSHNGDTRSRWSVGNSSSQRWWNQVVAVLVISLVIQYAALLGPYPMTPPSTPTPDPSPQHHQGPPAYISQHTLKTPLTHPLGVVAARPSINTAYNQHSNSTTDPADLDVLQFYLSVLHPPTQLAAGLSYFSPASNTSTVSSTRSYDHHSGYPRPLQDDTDDGNKPRLLLWSWLGLVAVQPLVLWILGAAAAIALSAMIHGQTHSSANTESTHDATPGPALSLHYPIDVRSSDVARTSGISMQPEQTSTFIDCTQDSTSEQQQQQQPALFMPVAYSSMSQWSLLDWSRYHLLKHSLDLVLVCVAALCTMQKDLLHAVYLAITLVFFRQRHRLMTATAADSSSSSSREWQLDRRQFQWLPIFNFCVMLATLIYQAPLELILGQPWSNTCQLGPGTPPRCTLPHLLGFCKLLTWHKSLNPTPAAAAALGPVAYSYSYAYGPFAGYSSSTLFITSGAFADLLLWVLLRLQYKLFRSELYRQLMQCLTEEQGATAAQQQRQRQQWYNQQARNALEMSRLRLARTVRISKLKASMLADEHTSSVVYRTSSTADTAATWAGNASEQGFDMPWKQQQQQQQQRTAGGELRYSASSNISGLPRPRSHCRLSDLPLQQQQWQQQWQQQQPIGIAALPQGFSGTRYRHTRTASDPHVGLRWSAQVMEQQQQQHQRSGSGVGIAAASSTGTLPESAANAAVSRTGSSTIAAAAAVPREYIVPDPRLSSLLGAAGSSATGRSTQSIFEDGNSLGSDGALTARSAMAGVHTQVSVPRRPGSWPSSLSVAAAADRAAEPASRRSRSRSDLTPARPAAAAAAGQSSRLHRWVMTSFIGSSGWQAGLCYALFILGFALDFSLFSLVYVVSMLLVPLLAAGRAKAYWTVMLVYTEVLLFMQYSFLTAARCLCVSSSDGNGTGHSTADPSPSSAHTSSSGTCTWILRGLDPYTTRHYADVLGLHNTSAGVLPFFLIYLATLVYNYRLRDTQGLELLQPTRSGSTAPASAPTASYGVATGNATLTLLRALQGWYKQLLLWVQLQLHYLAYHIRCIALYHERGPSWLKLDLAPPPPGHPGWTTSEGAAILAQGFERALDGLRESDITYATCVVSGSDTATAAGAVGGDGEDMTWGQRQEQQQQQQQKQQQQQQQQEQQQEQQQSEDSWSEVSDPGSRISRHSSMDEQLEIQSASERSAVHHTQSPPSAPQPEKDYNPAATPSFPVGSPSQLVMLASAAAAAAASSGFWDLLGLGSSSPLLNPAMAAVSRHAGEAGGLSSYTRLVLRLDRVILAQQHGGETGGMQDCGSVVALFEVMSEAFQLQAEWSLPWWPRRSCRPGRDAAAALLRLITTHTATTAINTATAASYDSNVAAAFGSQGGLADPQKVQGLTALQPESQAAQAAAIRGDSRLQQQKQQLQQLQQAAPAAHVVFDALMGMPQSDVQLASSLASSVAVVAAPVAAAEVRGAAPLAGDVASAQQPGSTTSTAAAVETAEGTQDTSITTSYTTPTSPLDNQQQQQNMPTAQTADLHPQQPERPSPPPPPPSAAAAQPAGSNSLPATVLGVEHHARPQQDYYALNAILDFLAFIYLAIFYQVVMSNTRTLADLTDERQIPWDYLNALLLLFIVTVTDRLVYSLGSHLGKFLLLLGQLLLFIPVCVNLYWSPAASSSGSHARLHLRVFMVIKCVSWVVTALQLKSGFPPRASFDGGGRQRFVFYKKPDTWHMMGFYVFQAVPFLYELRALLDWTCSATPLNWYQWLKLEDIRASLFIEQCRGTGREQRVIGERVPRYIKFLQGTLLFCLLLLAIWAPLLLFSSGAPTYTTPGIVEARVNASLGVVTQYGHYQGVMSFPVFEAGSRRTVQNWASGDSSSSGGGGGRGRRSLSRCSGQGSSTSSQRDGCLTSHNSSSSSSDGGAPLPPELSSYSPDQVKLVCLSQDSDQLWQLSPPARSALAVVLQEPSAALQLSWSIIRTAPLASGKGGPGCEGQINVMLAGETRMQLLEVVRGERESAQLMALNASDPEGWAPGHTGPVGLYLLFWRLRGEACAVKTYGGDTSSDSNTHSKDNGRNSNRQHYKAALSVALRGDSSRYSRGVWYGTYNRQQQQQNGLRHTANLGTYASPLPAQHAAAAAARPAAADKLPIQQMLSSKRRPQLRDSSYQDWAHIQVSCNVSIAGSEAAGGRWWQLHCSTVPTATTNQPAQDYLLHSSGNSPTGPMVSSPHSSTSSEPSKMQLPKTPEPQPPDPPEPQPPDPDDPDPSSGDSPGYAKCGPAVQGPMLVVVLERVQSGLLGAALSAFGITGLYFSVVFGIGRFLRLTVSNIRLRIPYEDFPSTRRLLAMVQDIYIARAEGELQLEEELFYLLLKIYKTPQLLDELTRLPPQQQQQQQGRRE